MLHVIHPIPGLHSSTFLARWGVICCVGVPSLALVVSSNMNMMVQPSWLVLEMSCDLDFGEIDNIVSVCLASGPLAAGKKKAAMLIRKDIVFWLFVGIGFSGSTLWVQ